MKIRWFFWNNHRVEHVAHHGIRPNEVDETLESVYRILKTRDGRYSLWGISAAGRYLAVVFEPPVDGNAWVVTARDMTKTEKRRFEQLL